MTPYIQYELDVAVEDIFAKKAESRTTTQTTPCSIYFTMKAKSKPLIMYSIKSPSMKEIFMVMLSVGLVKLCLN